jgi:inner membrane protein
MDSLTQIVLGAAVGEAILGKRVGNKAIFYGAIAGTIPDLDVLVSNFTDTVTGIEWHRGFSHSIVFAVLMAPILGYAVSKLERKARANWKHWSWLFFGGLVTHPLLDAFTTWGTQLFWPFEYRVAIQSIFVIDPLYTVPFLTFVILAMCQSRESSKRRTYNWLGLLVSTAYLLFTVVLKGTAYYQFKESLEGQGIEYVDIDNRPAPLSTILWTANVDTGESYLIGYYSFLDSQEIEYRSFPKNHDLLGDLINNGKIQRLIDISEGWYTISTKDGNLYFNDLRFGLTSLSPEADQFTFSYLITEGADGVQVEERERAEMDPAVLLPQLWDRMCGN